MLLLFGSLIGSYFNIPITILPGPLVRSGQIVDFFGMQYVVPLVTSWPGTVLAVNVGGAVIPTIMSTYLVIRYQLWLKSAIAIAAIAFIIHSMATPVHGIGIAVPVFAPVVTTAILAFILSREYAAPLAYIGGSMGTLIGADLLNLDKISWPWRSGRFDWRRGNVRRHLSHRDSRRPAGRHCFSLAPETGLVSEGVCRHSRLRELPPSPTINKKK